MNKYVKLSINVVLTALAITSIVFLSILLASKFNTIEGLKELPIDAVLSNGLCRDENIALAVRDIWGLFIANITFFLYIVKTAFFTALKCFKKSK